MELTDLISEKNIFLLDSPPETKEELLALVLRDCLECHQQTGDFDAVWATLLDRERSMSTGIGQGVAIPHCSTEAVSDVRGILVLLKNGIDFESLDEEPVRIIVLMLMPKNKFDRHIKTLAAVARAFSDPGFRSGILQATTAAEAHEFMSAAGEKAAGP